MADVVVMECGVMGWMPPPVTGGEIPGYVIRFFDGEDYTRSNYREIQRFKEDPDRRFATAENLPADCSRIIYADVRIYVTKNSTKLIIMLAMSHYTRELKIVMQVADP